jgi:hypothetical protein
MAVHCVMGPLHMKNAPIMHRLLIQHAHILCLEACCVSRLPGQIDNDTLFRYMFVNISLLFYY